MWFIGVEVEQETSAPPPKKKSWIRPWVVRNAFTSHLACRHAGRHAVNQTKLRTQASSRRPNMNCATV